MINTIVEPFAGLGAYSLRAMWMAAGARGDVRAEPPVSRTGNKAGFVPNSFRAWGLNRARWKRVWLNDASAVCHLFHLMYSSDALRREVVKRIYAMIPCPDCNGDAIKAALRGDLKPTPETLKGKGGCLLCGGSGVYEARLLWEKTRKESIPGDVAQMVASGLFLQQRTIFSMSMDIEQGQWQDLGYKPERVDKIRESGGSVGAMVLRDDLASRVESLPCGMAELADVTARALFMQSRSFSLTPVEIVGGGWKHQGMKPEIDDYARKDSPDHVSEDSPRWTVAGRVEAMPGRWETQGMSPEMREGRFTPDQGSRWTVADRSNKMPLSGVEIRATWGDAALVMPDGDASNVLCVLDPPYVGTSGYQADCPREVVLRLARAWHEAGALVLLHEACGLARELGTGWFERPADVLRGRASSFWSGGEQKEFITANRKTVWWPEEQGRLF